MSPITLVALDTLITIGTVLVSVRLAAKRQGEGSRGRDRDGASVRGATTLIS